MSDNEREELEIKIHVDSTEVDEAIKKLDLLIAKAKEADEFIESI